MKLLLIILFFAQQLSVLNAQFLGNYAKSIIPPSNIVFIDSSLNYTQHEVLEYIEAETLIYDKHISKIAYKVNETTNIGYIETEKLISLFVKTDDGLFYSVGKNYIYEIFPTEVDFFWITKNKKVLIDEYKPEFGFVQNIQIKPLYNHAIYKKIISVFWTDGDCCCSDGFYTFYLLTHEDKIKVIKNSRFDLLCDSGHYTIRLPHEAFGEKGKIILSEVEFKYDSNSKTSLISKIHKTKEIKF